MLTLCHSTGNVLIVSDNHHVNQALLSCQIGYSGDKGYHHLTTGIMAEVANEFNFH